MSSLVRDQIPPPPPPPPPSPGDGGTPIIPGRGGGGGGGGGTVVIDRGSVPDGPVDPSEDGFDRLIVRP